MFSKGLVPNTIIKRQEWTAWCRRVTLTTAKRKFQNGSLLTFCINLHLV